MIEAGARELVTFAVTQVELVRGTRIDLTGSERIKLVRSLVAKAATAAGKRALARWALVGPAYAREVGRARSEFQRHLHRRRAMDRASALGLQLPKACRTIDDLKPSPRPLATDIVAWRDLLPTLVPIEVTALVDAPEYQPLLSEPVLGDVMRDKLIEDADLEANVVEAIHTTKIALRALLAQIARLRSPRPACSSASPVSE